MGLGLNIILAGVWGEVHVEMKGHDWGWRSFFSSLEPRSQPETIGCSNMAMKVLYIASGCFVDTSSHFLLVTGVPGLGLTSMTSTRP